VSPSPRAVVALAVIALSALILPLGIAALAAVALVAATVVDAVSARQAPEGRRDAPEVLSRGVPARLQARATAPAGGSVRVRQAAPAGVDIEPREADGALTATITARRRGRHTLPAIAARATGPLGLARWDHACGRTAELRVFPDLHTARRLAVTVARGRFREQGATAYGLLGLGTEFELIRDYLPDDDIRQVNWRATARVGRPMSNQYRLEQDRDLIVLVDAGRLSAAQLYAGPGDPRGERSEPAGRAIASVLDAELNAAVAIALVADQLGDRCGAVAFDREIRTALPPRRQGGATVVRALFDLEPRSVDSDYELAFRRAEGSKRSLVVVLCDLIEEAAARPLAEAVPVLARRHAVIVAAPKDPALERLAKGDDARATIAKDVLEARAKAVARVKAAGARVLEAPPDKLAAACVAAYLRAKSRAAL
jgi:uncharacterized protein (DUF58 family)